MYSVNNLHVYCPALRRNILGKGGFTKQNHKVCMLHDAVLSHETQIDFFLCIIINASDQSDIRSHMYATQDHAYYKKTGL